MSDVVNPPSGGLSLYEQFNGAGRCRQSRAPVILGSNDQQKQAIIWQPPCNQWACKECRIILRAKAAIRAYTGAMQILDADQDVYFVTLTSHESLTPGQSWWVLPKAWNKLRTRAAREQADGMYFMIPEHHKSGKAHAHMITNYGMSRKWWKDNGRESGFGFKNDTQIARTAPGAGVYAVKYLIKQIHGAIWKKGRRRIMASQNWPALPDVDGAQGWNFEAIPRDQTLQYTYRLMQESGFDVRLLEPGQRLDVLDQIFGEISLEHERMREHGLNIE